MKQLFAALLALCLMLACPMAALAQQTETIDISVDAVRAEAGAQEAAVVVSLANCAGMDSIQLRLHYDETCVRLSSVGTSGLLDEGLHVLNTEKSGLLILAFASAEGLRADKGTLLELNFTLVNEAGSAVTVSDVLATRYDKESGVQSKAYVTLQDGGITFREDGTMPEAVVTPWIAETPAPTPEPTPEPTEVPVSVTETAETSDKTPEKTEKKTGGIPIFLLLPGIAAVLLFAIAAWLIVSDRKKKREAERIRAEKLAAKRAARRAEAANREKKTADADDASSKE